MLGLLISINGLNVVNSYVGRDFMTAISDRHPQRYARYALLYLGVFAASTVVAVFNRFSEERLRLLWREWLTRVLINGYLSGHTYYRLKAREEIDNPDQRITDDVKAYTQTTLSFFILSLNSAITSVAFLGVLWSIRPLLVVVAVLYAAVGTTATLVLGRRLVQLNNLQLKKEADLRYDLIQVREAAETIATLGIERAIRVRLRSPSGRGGGEHPGDHRREPEPRLPHQRLQLPDPARPAPDRGSVVPARRRSSSASSRSRRWRSPRSSAPSR